MTIKRTGRGHRACTQRQYTEPVHRTSAAAILVLRMLSLTPLRMPFVDAALMPRLCFAHAHPFLIIIIIISIIIIIVIIII